MCESKCVNFFPHDLLLVPFCSIPLATTARHDLFSIFISFSLVDDTEPEI